MRDTSQRRLPHEHRAHVVYVARDAEGRALYVGSTQNLKRRMSAHRSKPWADRVARWDVSQEMSWEDAIEAEAQTIAAESPEFNHQRTAGAKWVRYGVRHELAREREEKRAQRTPRRSERISAAAALRMAREAGLDVDSFVLTPSDLSRKRQATKARRT